MRRITIDVQGGDSAHRARLREHFARPVRFPDGTIRLIKSRAVLWETLAEIQEDLAFTEQEFAGLVFKQACSRASRYGTSLEAEIQWCWNRKAEDFWCAHYAGCRTLSNV